MARVWTSGFEVYANGATTPADCTLNGTASVQTATKGPYGNAALRCNPASGAKGFVYAGTFGATGAAAAFSKTTIYAKCRFRVATLPSSGQRNQVMGIAYGVPTTVSNVSIWVDIDSSGLLHGWFNAAQLGTGTTTISTNTWYTLECKCTYAVTGEFTLRINGTQEWTSTPNITGTQQYVTFGRFDTTASACDMYFDDCSAGDEWVGGTAVTNLKPDGAGYVTGWTGGTGNTYAEIDEDSAYVNTDYIQSVDGTNVTSGFTCGNLASGATPIFVQPWYVAIRSGTANCNTQIGVRSNGTNALSTSRAVSSTAVYSAKVQATDPSGGGAWTEARVNAAEVVLLDATTTAAANVRAYAAGLQVEWTPSAAITGTGASTTTIAEQSATGLRGYVGTAAQTTTVNSQAATGLSGYIGSGAQTTGANTQAASGLETFTGTSAQTATACSQAVTAALTLSGSAAQTLSINSQSATGAETFTGSSAQTTTAASQSVTGGETFSASGASSAGAAEQDATGTVTAGASFAGTVDQAASPCEQAAAGLQAFSGSAAQIAQGAAQAVTATESFLGTGAQSATAASQAIAGLEEFIGLSDLLSAQSEQDAAGNVGALAITGAIAQNYGMKTNIFICCE
jgi:fibronectin-binding autotransporter adhesin